MSAAYTSFEDRYRCPGCGARIDFADDVMFTCVGCGDEWVPETFTPDKGRVYVDTIPVGVGDTVLFKRNRVPVKGEVVKVNRRSISVRLTDVGFGPIDPPLLGTVVVKPERVFNVGYVS